MTECAWPDEPALLAILEAARSAPSGDNLQPFRYRCDHADARLDVVFCPDRAAHVLDVAGKASRLTLGMVLASIRLAARAEGWEPVVQEYDAARALSPPSAADAAWASVRFARCTPVRDPLLDGLPLRHADRRVYRPEQATAAARAALPTLPRTLPTFAGARTGVDLAEPGNPALRRWIRRADADLWRAPAIPEDALRWVRFDPRALAEHGEGVSFRNLGLPPLLAAGVAVARSAPVALRLGARGPGLLPPPRPGLPEARHWCAGLPRGRRLPRRLRPRRSRHAGRWRRRSAPFPRHSRRSRRRRSAAGRARRPAPSRRLHPGDQLGDGGAKAGPRRASRRRPRPEHRRALHRRADRRVVDRRRGAPDDGPRRAARPHRAGGRARRRARRRRAGAVATERRLGGAAQRAGGDGLRRTPRRDRRAAGHDAGARRGDPRGARQHRRAHPAARAGRRSPDRLRRVGAAAGTERGAVELRHWPPTRRRRRPRSAALGAAHHRPGRPAGCAARARRRQQRCLDRARPGGSLPAPVRWNAPGRSPRPALPIAFRAAQTPAEQAVVALVEELLGIAGVGADDDFFALGGDSLVTMRLVEAVRRRHGVELPPSAAFGGLTAARLARYFPAEAGAVAMPTTPGDALPSCLVPLRMTGDDAPLFFVHPAAGVVFPYFELARALPASRPFWALQAVGLGGEEAPDPDVRAMARRYIAAMRQIQPRGPYHVGAYSFGCYVAFEMARQLEAVGERVATLGLVDEAAPLDGHRPTPAMMSQIIFGRAGRTLAHHLHDYLPQSAAADRRPR